MHNDLLHSFSPSLYILGLTRFLREETPWASICSIALSLSLFNYLFFSFTLYLCSSLSLSRPLSIYLTLSCLSVSHLEAGEGVLLANIFFASSERRDTVGFGAIVIGRFVSSTWKKRGCHSEPIFKSTSFHNVKLISSTATSKFRNPNKTKHPQLMSFG